jgi:hypothetical protein
VTALSVPCSPPCSGAFIAVVAGCCWTPLSHRLSCWSSLRSALQAEELVTLGVVSASGQSPVAAPDIPCILMPCDQAYVELWVGVKSHACFSHVAKSKTRSKKKQVMQFDQEYASVWFSCTNSFCV